MEIHLSIKRGSVHVYFMNIAHHQSDNRRKYVISSKIRKLFLYSQEPCRDSTLNSTVNVARFTTPRVACCEQAFIYILIQMYFVQISARECGHKKMLLFIWLISYCAASRPNGAAQLKL